MLLTVHSNKSRKSRTGEDEEWQDIVVAGQKSGFVWALDRDDGHILWDAVAGPGGDAGGASWGSATDGKRVYTSIINNEKMNFTLVPTSVVITYGGWVAINSSSGTVLWSTAAPDASYPVGPVSVANGVVFGTTLGAPSGSGSVYALDSKSGDVLWKYKATASLAGGLSIHNGCVFLGEGVTAGTAIAFPNSTIAGHVVNAFCVVD
jgi:outer membrane protein assembly factor BamB